MLQLSSELLWRGGGAGEGVAHSDNYQLHLVSGISRQALRRKATCNCYPGLHYLLSLFGLRRKVEGTLAIAQHDMAGMGMAWLLPQIVLSGPPVALSPSPHCHLLWDRALAGGLWGCTQAVNGQGADCPLCEPGSVAISSRWHPLGQVTPN